MKNILLHSALTFGCALSILACQGKDQTPYEPKELDPISQAQSDQFNSLMDAIGRPEQVIRVMKNENPTWGSADAATATIRAALPSPACEVKFLSEPNPQNKYRRILQVSGADCPLQLQYSLEQRFEGQPYEFQASYLFTNDTLATQNGLRGLTMKWTAKTNKRASNTSFSYEWNLKGEGKIITVDNQELKILNSINMKTLTSNQETYKAGTYRFQISGGNTYFALIGGYSQDAKAPDNSKFKINGTEISRSAFENYLSRLGFFVAADSFTDAG